MGSFPNPTSLHTRASSPPGAANSWLLGALARYGASIANVALLSRRVCAASAEPRFTRRARLILNISSVQEFRHVASKLGEERDWGHVDLSKAVNEIAHDERDAVYRALANAKVKVLTIAHSQISDVGAEALCRVLSANPSLVELRLAGNSIDAEGAVLLGDALKTGHPLECLDLSFNSAWDLGAAALCQALSTTNASLRKLILFSNKLGADSGLHIGQMLAVNKSFDLFVCRGDPKNSANVDGLLAKPYVSTCHCS
eukprot:Selendium_serpulae@DN2098_c0_g1_i2.p1